MDVCADLRIDCIRVKPFSKRFPPIAIVALILALILAHGHCRRWKVLSAR